MSNFVAPIHVAMAHGKTESKEGIAVAEKARQINKTGKDTT